MDRMTALRFAFATLGRPVLGMVSKVASEHGLGPRPSRGALRYATLRAVTQPSAEAKPCAHSWAPTETPPAASSPWFRCTACLVFGYRRQGSTRGDIRPYQCTYGLASRTTKQCKNDAVAREPGSLARGGFRWKCAEHAPPAETQPGHVG